MKKRKVTKCCFGFAIAMIVSIQFAQAQNNSDSASETGLHSFLKCKISWHGGLEWEKKISKASVVNLFAGVGVGRQTDELFDFKAHLIFVPVAFAEYRNYYNFFRRASNHKNTGGNSANFLFGRAEAIFAVHNQNYFNLFIAQGWGAQRSLSRKIMVDCHLGITDTCFMINPANDSAI